MGTKNYKAMIVEGNVREPKIIDNLKRIYFQSSNFKIITLAAEQNIYMLWKRMQEDNFETDIIEVLRESSKKVKINLEGLGRNDFSEIFLFFDYDKQQNNLPTNEDIDPEGVIIQMLQTFDNETENGKLYISYPMVEALRDYTPDMCGNKEDCFWDAENRLEEGYKKISAERSPTEHFGEYSFLTWKDIFNVFAMRVTCLMGEKEDIISYGVYSKEISPETIYMAQQSWIQQGKVFILSAFPEFLLDYFSEAFWNTCMMHKKLQKATLQCTGFLKH